MICKGFNIEQKKEILDRAHGDVRAERELAVLLARLLRTEERLDLDDLVEVRAVVLHLRAELPALQHTAEERL